MLLKRWHRLLLAIALLPLAAPAQEGVARRELLVGQSIALQGGRNAYAQAVQEGVLAHLNAVNERGGVHGRRIVLKTLDDDNKGSQAEANARALVQEHKVFLLFGSIEGGPSTGVMKAAVELGVPFFGPMAGSPTLRRPHQPLVFPVRAEHREEFRALLEYARRTGANRAAFVRSDSETGLQHLENVRILCRELGMELVADLPFKGDITDAQIGEMAQRIGQSGAQVVINHGSPAMYEKLIRRARAAGVRAAFSAVNSGSAQMAQQLGELAHGMVFAQVVPDPMERKTEIAREYQQQFAKAWPGKAFSYGSLEGYITAKALVAALQLAGRDPTRERFVSALQKAGGLDVNGLKLRYEPGDHAGLSLVDLSIYSREGRFRH
ncbi:ABC transporter substrate-binding protein [Ramlibacter sp.]|uniref:ABC transporter substrate-binding protein n=1 Tax=Ramlibacter sp. TaxID=1917967 RepID=UPI0035AE6DBD